MYTIVANQISDNIDLDSFKVAYPAELLYSDDLELYYEVGTEIYVSVFKYGVVCFFNCDEVIMSEFADIASTQCDYFYDGELSRVFEIEPQADELKFGVKKAHLTYFDIDTLRVIMLNLAQSVALDFYFQRTRVLLEQTSKHTEYLEKKGKLEISDKQLKKFIGKNHNLKNQIVENLHIFHTLQQSHQNDYFIQIENEMKIVLLMDRRFENIYRELDIVSEHLEYFSNLMNHGASMKLEWIIIILLGIFVFNIFLSYLL